MVALDPSGNTLWAQTYGDEELQRANGVACDSTGAPIFTGSFKGGINLGEGPEYAANNAVDIFLAKRPP